eukprot:Platyproteum_vivax@DN4538_c0_g1_i1.p2
MAIEGLHELFGAKLQHTVLEQNKLVIDGNSLCHYLLKLCLLSGTAGDYQTIEDRVAEFFALLIQLEIECYVVFGGGYIEGKFESEKQRYIEDLPEPDPPLAVETMQHVLKEYDIYYYTADGEADNEAAGLANRLECPLLTEKWLSVFTNMLYGSLLSPKKRSAKVHRS